MIAAGVAGIVGTVLCVLVCLVCAVLALVGATLMQGCQGEANGGYLIGRAILVLSVVIAVASIVLRVLV